jgi:protein translocase SEC61 complex gamma subunit
MGIGDFLESARHLLQTINRPDWKTFSLSAKIVLAGVALLGGIGFVIRVIATTLSGLG